MEEERPYYHFSLYIDFESGSCSPGLMDALLRLGFETLVTRGVRKWRRFCYSGQEEYDLIVSPLLEEFTLRVQKMIKPLLRDILHEEGSLSLVCVLHEYSHLNNAALQVSLPTIKALNEMSCTLDFDRYLYTNDDSETY